MGTDTATQTETQAAIREATYRALCKHGYADLTIQRIADEFPKSKSLLYYHYDDKDEILIDLLESVLDQFTFDTVIDSDDSPDEQLWTLIDDFLPESPTEEQRESQIALFELRSQALSKQAYRDQFTHADRLLNDALTDILTAGVNDGTFRAVDVDETADILVSMATGAMLRRATTSENITSQTRTAVTQFINSQLLAVGR
jgi:AcrR family transcriptional regulator